MASNIDYLNYVIELLREVDDITYKRMMGEYLLYVDGVLFGGVYDNRFLVKKTSSIEKYGFIEQTPYEGAKPMYLVDIEDSNEIKDIVLLLYSDLKR